MTTNQEMLVQSLNIPQNFTSKSIDDPSIVQWNTSWQTIIRNLERGQTPDAQIISSVAQLSGQEDWLAPETLNLAQEFLSSFDIRTDLVKSVLENHVKSWFIANPHPQLNPSTGRALHRVAGGPMASQDYYEDQVWKNHLGLANIVSWCVRQVPPGDYEQVWHLLVPPIMTFLDDYQSPYKLRGVGLASDLLENVPVSLLKRTGIDQLISTSLFRVLMNLHDDLSPRLTRTSVPVILRLIEMTTPPDSAGRFDQLCNLLGDHIIGSIWLYAARERETIEASMDVLPSIVKLLGIGTVRYLKALIPQCNHNITLNDLAPRSKSLEVASLRALVAIIQECQPRIPSWKGTIIEGVGKYWVTIYECPEKDETDETAESLVRTIFTELSKACSSLLENEYPRLLRMEPALLQGVIAH